jgi:arylsulfatase A-like enzyme
MQFLRLAAAGAVTAALLAGVPARAAPHNVVIFVADGLRSHAVTPESAPALAALRAEGVDFANSHSLYPTVTTPNASVIATGHLLADTGDFGNTIWVGKPFGPPYGSPLAAVEDDVMLGLLNERFGGNYLGETTLLAAARAKGFSTAVIGKNGPVGVQDVTARDGQATIIVDDQTGFNDEGVPLAPDVKAAIKAAGLQTSAPDRGLNGWGGAYNMAGVQVANVEQQNWFVGVATKVVLPRFKAAGKPFVLVFWSRDPDGTQHDQGDSLNALTPGINGPTTQLAFENVSNNLQAIRDALKALGLDQDTDIVVTADHGFSTMSRQSQTSSAAKLRYPDVVPGFLPRGFLAIDMAKALNLRLMDANGFDVETAKGFYPKAGAIVGGDAEHPQIIIAPNGGTALIYLPGPDAKALAPKVVEFLTSQDYTGGIFVNDALGEVPGALPMSRVGLIGRARTPQPSIVVSFKSWSSGCADPEMCGVEVADSGQQQGQGIHGAFGRADTHNFMAVAGPDFKKGFVDPAPVSNADWANTLARVLGLELSANGQARGRVMSEALAEGGAAPDAKPIVVASAPAANGFTTVLNAQEAAGETYFDAAGAPGRTLGLKVPDHVDAGRAAP